MPAAFPASLPAPAQDYGYRPDSGTIRTEMEGGIARQRRRYTARTRICRVRWEFDEQELWLFEGFVAHVLKGGSLPFTIALPFGGDTGDGGLKTNTATLVEGAYSVSHIPHLHFAVTAELEVIDADVMTAAEAATEFA